MVPRTVLFLFAVVLIEASPPGVIVLDGASIGRVMSTEQPAAVLFVDSSTPDQEEVLRAINFKQLAQDFGNSGNRLASSLQFGSLDCAAHPEACEARKVARGSRPVVKYWSGNTFRRYTGPLDVEALREYLARKLVENLPPPSVVPTSTRRAPEPRDPHAPVWHENDDELTIATVFALVVSLIFFGRWLATTPAVEAPGTLVLVGSSASRCARTPHARDGTNALWVMRLDELPSIVAGAASPPELRLTPLSRVPVAEADLTALCFAARKRDGALLFHAPTRDGVGTAGRGGVVSFAWDPSRSPCVQVLTWANALDSAHAHTLTLLSAGIVGIGRGCDRVALGSVGGRVTRMDLFLPPLLKTSWWQFWRRAKPVQAVVAAQIAPAHAAGKTGAAGPSPLMQSLRIVSAAAESRAGKGGKGGGKKGHEQLAPPSKYASHLLVADPLADELRLYALPPEGSVGEFLIRLVGSLQLDLGATGPASPCAMATHPSAPLAYLLCTRAADGAGLIVVCELSSVAPPTIVEVFVMSAPSGGGTSKSVAAAAAGEADLAGDIGGALCVSVDGKHIYAAVPGTAIVAIVAITAEGRRLSPNGHAAIGSAAFHLLATAHEVLAAGGSTEGSSAGTPPPERRPPSVPTALALAGSQQTALLLTDAGTERVYCFRRDRASGALEPQCSLAVESPAAMQPVVWPQ
jgi:hypothetical protein